MELSFKPFFKSKVLWSKKKKKSNLVAILKLLPLTTNLGKYETLLIVFLSVIFRIGKRFHTFFFTFSFNWRLTVTLSFQFTLYWLILFSLCNSRNRWSHSRIPEQPHFSFGFSVFIFYPQQEPHQSTLILCVLLAAGMEFIFFPGLSFRFRMRIMLLAHWCCRNF